MKYNNSRNFDDNTEEDFRVSSEYPFVSPHPADPVTGERSTGDMTFATGPIRVGPDGDVDTRLSGGGSNNVSGQPSAGGGGGV